MRSAIRPPVALRDGDRSPHPEPDNRGIWEVPAGLVEPDEESPEGLRQAARRELEEEAGFVVTPQQLRPLGHPTYPAPGIIAERHFFFEVEVDLDSGRAPSLDGSPLEAAGAVVAVPLERLLKEPLEDAKTELALRRLADRYPQESR